MPALTASQALPLQLEKVAPYIAEAIEATGILSRFLGQGGLGAERVSLRSFRVRLLTSLASNPQQIGLDSGALPPGIGDKWDQMLLSPVSWCLGIQYSQLAQLVGEGEGVSTDNSVTKTISDVARQAVNSRDIFLQTPGDGSLASIDSTTGNNYINVRSASTAVIDGRRASLLKEQQVVQVMSSAYVLRGSCTILQVFKGLGQTQQVQVDQIPAGTVTGDLIIVGGASPGAPTFINGIPVFVNTLTTGNLYGISMYRKNKNSLRGFSGMPKLRTNGGFTSGESNDRVGIFSTNRSWGDRGHPMRYTPQRMIFFGDEAESA